MPRKLFGRQTELGVLSSLLDGIGGRGSAIVIRGPAGIGKSAMVSAISAEASVRGLQVLSAAGVEGEANLPFAALHQLLQPVLGDLTQLPGPQRNAIEAAFGIVDSPAPQLFLIALATLDLLSGIAERAPLLIASRVVRILAPANSTGQFPAVLSI